MQDLTPQFNTAQIKAMILKKAKRFEDAALSRLQRIGESFVANARQFGTYMDQTGNLRSSIGYVVLRDGLQYAEGGFALIKGGGEGVETGRAVIEDIARRFPIGLALICVAGQSYAAAVEAKGRDVITGSSLIAKQDLKKSIDELQAKARR